MVRLVLGRGSTSAGGWCPVRGTVWAAVGVVVLLLGSALGQEQGLRRHVAAGAAAAGPLEVRLDVVVTDAKGHALAGLKAGDFSVSEDGVAQRVVSVEEHAPVDPGAAAKVIAAGALGEDRFTNRVAPGGGDSSTVLVLNGMMPEGTRDYVKKEVERLVKGVQPGTRLAIFEMVDTGMRMIVGMTADPKVLEEAAAAKWYEPVRAMGGGGGGGGRRGGGDGGDGSGGQSQGVARVPQGYSLQELGDYLAQFPGRKSLVWVTSGGVGMVAGEGSPFRDALETATVDGRPVRVLTLSRVALYPINGRSAAGQVLFDPDRDAELSADAESTGGKAYHSVNALKDTVMEVVGTGSHFYTVTYAAGKPAMDGGVRAVKVEVQRPGARLAYRRQYWATGEGVARVRVEGAAASDTHGRATLAQAMVMGGPPAMDVLFDAEVRPAAEVKTDGTAGFADQRRRKGYRLVTIRYRMGVDGLHLVKGADGRYRDKVEFAAIVYDRAGVVVNGTKAVLPVDVDEAGYAKMVADGVEMGQTLAIPAEGKAGGNDLAGDTDVLRLGVHGVGGNGVGSLEVPVRLLVVSGK
jgi:VWFA-related protein